jgi:sensor histidine kinase regulating citrate/malate metabolism
MQEVTTLPHANCSQTVDEIVAAGIIHGTFHKILFVDLNMSCVSQHSVSCALTQDQHDSCMRICGDLINNADEDVTFLNRIITGDETWRFLYDPQLKRQLVI